MERPKCGRCHGPLDLFRDPDSGWGFECNNTRGVPTPAMNEQEFQQEWYELPADDAVRLEKQTRGEE